VQFIFEESCGKNSLNVNNETYKYLFKARRHKIDDVLAFRNLIDDFVYMYKVITINKKEALLQLDSKEEKRVEATKKLHIIWCMVDNKTVEKQLPYLNELGVDKISFVYCDYSQKNFKPNFDKMNKILINSSQQCGRSSIITLELIDSLEIFLKNYPDTYMLNFSDKYIDSNSDIERIIIGCEGGFSQSEIEKFDKEKIVGLNSNLILKSETAITAVASKIIV